MDGSALIKMGWSERVDLLEGLKSTYKWYFNKRD